MTATFKKNGILIILTILVFLGMMTFNLFHYSSSYGLVEINNRNSLFLIPFIILVCWLGILLGTTKKNTEFEKAYQKQITDREKKVIELISQGKKNQEIANELYNDISTIKTHLNNIYKKTGAKSRKELAQLSRAILEKGGNQ